MIPALPKIQLEQLHERHVGLTESIAGTFYEAASVCLNRHHKSPIAMDITSSSAVSTRLVEFTRPDTRVLNAWANDIDTTESGAYGICLAAVEACENLVAIGRAETLTGADWYVAPIGADPNDMEDSFRLEVSGLDAGDRPAVAARLKQKLEQARRGASNLPAIASVVGFRERAIFIQKVNSSK